MLAVGNPKKCKPYLWKARNPAGLHRVIGLVVDPDDPVAANAAREHYENRDWEC